MESLTIKIKTMKNHKSIYILLFLGIFFAQNLQAGGGWPQEKGHGYFKLGQWWLISDQHYTDVGLIDPNITIGLFNTYAYGEYGFTDKLTGLVYFPFFSRSYFNNTISGTTGETLVPGDAINGLGDTDIGIKYGLVTDKRIAVSATVLFGLPLGISDAGLTTAIQTGDGEFNQLVQIDAGTGFKIGKTSAYANAFVGFNNRTQGFSDEFRFGLEGGVTFANDRLTAILRIFGVKSLQNGNFDDLSNSSSVFANNSEHISFSPEIAYKLNDKWGVSAGFGGAFYGRIISARPSYSFGVFHQF
jgi:hypothetical protein